jgi:hypothetical protein
MKVFESSLLSPDHLDSDEGDDLIRKTAKMPLATILFAGSMVLHCGKVEGR